MPNEDKPFPVIVQLIALVVIGLLGLFVLVGLAGGFDGGNVPGKECFDYEVNDGWANSCDDG